MNKKSNKKSYPQAEKKYSSTVIHDTKLIDEYSWMRYKMWPKDIKNKKILSQVNLENKYFEQVMHPHQKSKNKLFNELKKRIPKEDKSPYVEIDNYFYYTRFSENKEYPIYCRKKGSTESNEEILLDMNEINKCNDFVNIGDVSISPNHHLIAYSTDQNGNEQFQIKIFDLTNKKHLKNQIRNTIGSIIWHEKEIGFFYTPLDKNWRHGELCFHKVISNRNIRNIFREENALYNLSISKSSSKEMIFLDITGHDSNEIYFIDMKEKSYAPQILKKRIKGVDYNYDHAAGFFYISTNEKAKKYKIIRMSDIDYSINNDWKEFIKEETRLLENFDITKNYLLLNYKSEKSGLDENEVLHLGSLKKKIISVPEACCTSKIYSTNYIKDDIRINYSSFTTPLVIFSYTFNSNTLKPIKVKKMPNSLKKEEYKIERIYVKNRNIDVPVSLFYKRSMVNKDGGNPVYLYGYGSYGYSIPPAFRNSAISLVDRGFIYAIAHIRGGGELGRQWYESAKFLRKKNTFSDFIACAKYLISKKYTTNEKIAIAGGSAGGMLIGNVINKCPHLFKLAIAHVPFVDVLNTMLDETLPLTPSEFKEWGNPKKKNYFNYMRQYSPYENIKKQNYPSIFATTGLYDPRVGYWEALKWIARIRENTTGNNDILLKINTKMGHSGSSGRFDSLNEVAEELAFVFKEFNITID